MKLLTRTESDALKAAIARMLNDPNEPDEIIAKMGGLSNPGIATAIIDAPDEVDVVDAGERIIVALDEKSWLIETDTTISTIRNLHWFEAE